MVPKGHRGTAAEVGIVVPRSAGAVPRRDGHDHDRLRNLLRSEGHNIPCTPEMRNEERARKRRVLAMVAEED